uniref:Uncharacterized protein n=1 Tax=Anopheles coluzzii TaxID=1518534 RepID=A0A8W7PY73_ANOCL
MKFSLESIPDQLSGCFRGLPGPSGLQPSVEPFSRPNIDPPPPAAGPPRCSIPPPPARVMLSSLAPSETIRLRCWPAPSPPASWYVWCSECAVELVKSSISG